MVEFDDILYTPLDFPDSPETDLEKLKIWMKEANSKQKGLRDFISKSGGTQELNLDEKYPWDLAFPYYNYYGESGKTAEWMYDFDLMFPEIKHYVEKFIDIEELGIFALVPKKKDQEGWGFWHKDVDPTGIRWYIEYETYKQDKLYIRPDWEKQYHECILKSNKQAFYLNNTYCEHTIYTEKESVGKTRIACIIMPRIDTKTNFVESSRELVVKSAEKYKDTYALLI
jgi:hypothetical protein